MIWFGGIFSYYSPSGVFITHTTPGTGQLDTIRAIDCTQNGDFSNFDKPWFAAGPNFDGSPGESVYALYEAFPSSGCGGPHPMYGKSSTSGSSHPAGEFWTTPAFAINANSPACGDLGMAVNGAVIPSGSRAGRVVVAFNDRINPGVLWPPRTVYSDDGGTTWHASVGPNLSDNLLGMDRDGSLIYAIDPPNVPPGNLTIWNFATVAVDPTNPDKVYVVFAGRPDPSLSYIDLYVAMSVDGGQHFLQGNLVHFRDFPLGGPSYPCYLVHPAITIDRCGAVNLMYYRLIPVSQIGSTAIQMDVRYARIKNFALPNQGVAWGTLTPQPFTTDALIGGGFGDYQMMASSGNYVWCWFASGHESTMSQSGMTSTSARSKCRVLSQTLTLMTPLMQQT
jgi:hypothetical protein